MEILLYNFLKNLMILFFYILKLPEIYSFLNNLFNKNNYIKIINYHDVLDTSVNNFEKQIKYISKKFQNCNYEDLLNFFNSNIIYPKPLVIISFDDGLKSHFDNVLPILNKYKMTGWFFIPSGLIGSLASKKNLLNEFNGDIFSVINKQIYLDKNIVFMNWGDVKQISNQNHVIGSHSYNHVRLVNGLPEDFIYKQVIKSKEIIEIKIKKDIHCFCWVGGEEYSYGKEVFKKVSENYKFSFMTNLKDVKKFDDQMFLQRTNLESFYSWPKFIFYISGIFDFFYSVKRKRIKNKLI